MPFLHRDVDNVGAPDIVEGVDDAVSQRVGKYFVTFGRNTRCGLRHQGFNPHDAGDVGEKLARSSVRNT